MDRVTPGLMGKHSGYGDFLQAGMSEVTLNALSGWLDATLPPLRDDMGDSWGAFWDGAQDLRFWMGRAVLGRTICGVLHPSRDRVGRRFPLLLTLEGAAVPLPLGAQSDQTVWEALSEHLSRMKPGQGASALLEGLTLVVDEEDPADAATGPTLWAHHPEGDLDALLSSAKVPDAQRARLTRSYWWAPGAMEEDPPRAATWLACPGLPEHRALGWLLAGVPATTEDAG